MLRQTAVADVRQGRVSRADGWIAVTMQTYPRGFPRTQRDEYLRMLAPDRDLFREFQAAQRSVGHDAAFARVRYEERFALTREAMSALLRLAERARSSDVFLVCQCAVGERCHREILLLLAARCFAAPAEQPLHPYPAFEQRLRGAGDPFALAPGDRFPP